MESQAQADMAAIASALEGFRLEHGSYPPSLAELSPAGTPPLPLDWITGKPFLYRADGDTYRLYSPGWNEQDEGGAPPAKDGSGAETGDWVWGMNFRPQGRPATASSGS
jgi:type II secretory pathway pseudopilin PulG